MRFKTETGEEITFPFNAHWILYWESVPEKDLNKAREDVHRIQQAKAKEQE
jgi:hypothetical protein